MNNYKIKILLSIITVVFFNFAFSSSVFAVTLTFQTEKETMYQQEQFLVDVFLAPDKNENTNAFDLSISYSSNLTFLGSKNGLSIGGIWVEKPNIKSGSINLVGIIPGGFKGLINPMDIDPVNNQKPGLLTQLIFIGNSEGKASIDFVKKVTLANDGLGTKQNTTGSGIFVNIDKKSVPSNLGIDDKNSPEHFLITLSHDPLLYDGKYAIFFETQDKESGIDYYEIKEEGKDWQRGESPYKTLNQPPNGTIFVKAVDYYGNSTTEKLIPNIPEKQIPSYSILFKIIFLFLFFIILVLILVVIIKRKNLSLKE